MIDPFLEQQYNVRARRRDFDDVVAGWSRRSERVRLERTCQLDLPYGPAERDRMDIFRTGDPDTPTLVYIHGGYWQRHDKSIYSFVSEAFVDSGINVAIPNYDLCPTVTIPDIVKQVRRAVTWLWNNAESIGITGDHINLSGHSAGGHLTAMMLTRDGQTPDSDIAGFVRSAIPISGVYELAPLRSTTINDAARIDGITEKDFSPVRLIPGTDAPVLAVLGGSETRLFRRQTEHFVLTWARQGVEITQYVEPGVDHFDVINRFADPGSELFKRVLAWLR